MKVRAFPGDTTQDLLDDVKPITRKNPDQIIVHFGTNDVTNGIDTKGKIQGTVDYIRQSTPETKLAISLCTLRKDKPGINEKIKETNNLIKEMCRKNNIHWIDNGNIDESCLGRGKLHLNKKGLSYLANNLKNFIDST